MVIHCARAALAACGALEILDAGRRAERAVCGGKEVAAGSSRGGAPIYRLGPYPARAPPVTTRRRLLFPRARRTPRAARRPGSRGCHTLKPQPADSASPLLKFITISGNYVFSGDNNGYLLVAKLLTGEARPPFGTSTLYFASNIETLACNSF